MNDIGWRLLEHAARLADAWLTGWWAARQRWHETAEETQERHRREDAEHQLSKR